MCEVLKWTVAMIRQVKIVRSVSIMLLLFSTLSVFAQKFDKNTLDKLTKGYIHESLEQLKSLLALANDAHYAEAIEENIKWCETAFENRGFKIQRLSTSRIPLLLASRIHPDAKKTVLVYLQIDGQPVDSAEWNQDNPYEATLKQQSANEGWNAINWGRLKEEINPEWRLFARSVSDAKGPAMMFLTAMDIINDAGYDPNYNIKVVMDFEEELGSPRLPEAVKTYSNELSSDMLVIFDGPRHTSNEPTLLFGARGISTLSIEVFGPRVPQHSGHYGNYSPNPALRLSKLLSSMYDEKGRVGIKGWYEGIAISDLARKQMALVPDKEEEIRQKLGIKTIDDIGKTYQESLQYPSLSILGMRSAWTDSQTRTIIPASATAELNIRLVRETNGERMVNLVKEHIRKQGYHLIDSSPTDQERQTYDKIARFNSSSFYEAFRTDFDSEIGIWLRKAMKRAFGKDPVQIRTSGGSIPISPFVTTLNIPAVIVPTVNKDNNQHSPNENLRLGNYLEGIKTIASILTQAL